MKTNEWIGVDFDGTLATYTHWVAPDSLGEPIPLMVERVKRWLAEGREVKILTARAWPLGVSVNVEDRYFVDASKAVQAIHEWCEKHLGRKLEVTCVKDYMMLELYDDRAVQVQANTGKLIGHSLRGF